MNHINYFLASVDPSIVHDNYRVSSWKCLHLGQKFANKLSEQRLSEGSFYNKARSKEYLNKIELAIILEVCIY